ncbi:MAG: hypothetical protein IJC48_08180 [Clostridia bacterium]|nr:hypothetical protein [Clostridia bacterium]MBQ4157681.1 hypothetical protein [Clostridia bacterium]
MENNRDTLFEEEMNEEVQGENVNEFEEEESYSEYAGEQDEEGYEEAYEDEEDGEYEDDYSSEDEEEDDEEYEEDDEEDEEENGDEEEVDDTAYIMQLFDFLQQALESGTSFPMTSKKLVDVEKCFSIIRDMKENLPDGIQFGMKINAERDRILEKAENIATTKVTTANVQAKSIKDEANDYAQNTIARARSDAKNMIQEAEAKAKAIIDNASMKAKKMVSESEVMQRARSEAAVLIENARVDAHERRLKAVNDAYRLLDALEKQTAGITEAIARRKNEMVGNSNSNR